MLFAALSAPFLTLRNRIVMAPMTRSRAADMATFYTPGPKGCTDYPTLNA
jgi:2,4-dienoyl-CoA reductase-like NADH-dependent reductase (Old Yellow Enzyme family)